MSNQPNPPTITALRAEVPHALEGALGYAGPARFFAVGNGTNDWPAMYDGQIVTPADAAAWRLYCRHIAHAKHMHDAARVGALADQWFLFDRQERVLLIGATEQVREALTVQWGGVTPGEVPVMRAAQPEELNALLESALAGLDVFDAERAAEMADERDARRLRVRLMLAQISAEARCN